MSDVRVTTRTGIETGKMVAVEVWPDGPQISMKQSSDIIYLDPAAVPAVIAALQAAAAEAEGQG